MLRGELTMTYTVRNLFLISSMAISSIAFAGTLPGTSTDLTDGPIVTPPGHGRLTVTGEDGAGQTSALGIWRCEADPVFILKQQSCYELHGNFEINKQINLPEGIYSLIYNHTIAHAVIVKNAQETAVNLIQISVPADNLTSGTTEFRVFRDLTSDEQMRSELLAQWASYTGAWESWACGNVTYQDICHAIHTSPDAMKNVTLKSDSQGDYVEVYIYANGRPRYWKNSGRKWVNDKSLTGDFISVFSGIYGVEFTGASGVKTTRYGIVAN